MGIRIEKAAAVGTNPLGGANVGDQVKVGWGEFLAKPPRGTHWHRPAASDTFTLYAQRFTPVLAANDVVGIAKGAPLPRAPEGCHFLRIYDATVPAERASDAAELYKLVGPSPLQRLVAFLTPPPSFAGAAALHLSAMASPGRGNRWMPILVDGRDLKQVHAVAVPRALAA